MTLHDFKGLMAMPRGRGSESVHKPAVDCIRVAVAEVSRLRPLKSAATGFIDERAWRSSGPDLSDREFDLRVDETRRDDVDRSSTGRGRDGTL